MVNTPFADNFRVESDGLKNYCRGDMFKFLQNNKDKLNISGIVNVSHHKEGPKASFDDEQSEEVEFDLLHFGDGRTVKVNVSVTPKGGNGGGEVSPKYALDLANVRTEAEAKQALDAFHQMIVEAELNFHGKDDKISLYRHGNSKWDYLAHDSFARVINDNRQRFVDKGIASFSLDGKLVADFRQDIKNAQELKTQNKPWDVPHGAPKPPGSTSH